MKVDSAGRPALSPLASVIGALAGTALDAALLVLALGGIAGLLAHRRALALLGVWLVGALVLALLRPVRALAGTRREPDPLLLAALFLLPLLAPPLAALGERAGLAILPGGRLLGVAGLGLVAAGLGVRIAAMRELGSRFDPTVAIVPGHALETRGLYARMRHPGYAGAWLAALGGVLVFRSALGLVPVLLMAAALALRVRHEERVLETEFGDDFRAWRARTGAFLPR